MNFRVTNRKYIKKLLESNLSASDVKEMIVNIENVDPFLESLLDDLNEDSDWPLAVNPALIVDVNSESECAIRAKNVVEMIVEKDLYGLNVLDFGCGDGMVAAEMMARGARKVVAYDLQEHKFWSGINNVVFTTTTVASNGPYEFILLYDVLDHVMNVDPSMVLQDLRTLLTPDGIITIRCHPWIARHGAHLYQQINRAFLHVIFEEDRLARHGYKCLPTRKVVHPLNSYKKWFEKAGLKVVKEDKIMEPVEDYFLNNDLLKNLIQRHFNDSPFEDYKQGKGDLSRLMSFHFIDFILRK